MSTLSTHIRKSNVKPHPNLRSKMPEAGTENIVAFSRVLKGPRVPKRPPQLGLVLRGTVGSTRFHPRDLKVILTTLSEPRISHRL